MTRRHMDARRRCSWNPGSRQGNNAREGPVINSAGLAGSVMFLTDGRAGGRAGLTLVPHSGPSLKPLRSLFPCLPFFFVSFFCWKNTTISGCVTVHMSEQYRTCGTSSAMLFLLGACLRKDISTLKVLHLYHIRSPFRL